MLWIAAAALAALCALWSFAFAAGVPEPNAWRRVLGMTPLRFEAAELIDFGAGPALLVFSWTRVGLIELGLSYATLAVFAFGIALVSTALLAAYVRRGIAGRLSGAWRAAILLLICAAAFSPAYAADWLVLERFRVFAPVACLALAGLCLTEGRWFAPRFLIAALVAQVAIYSDISGAFVWVALAPMAFVGPGSARRRGAWLAWWLLLGNLGIAACWIGFGEPVVALDGIPDTKSAASALDWLATFTRLVGRSTPDLWPALSVDEFGIGVLLLVLFVLASALTCRQRTRVSAIWWSLAAFGLFAAVAATLTVVGSRADAVTERELLWAAPLLPAGLAGMVAELCGARIRALVRAALPVALVLFVQDWQRGFSDLLDRRQALRESEARLVFSGLPGVTEDELGPLPCHKNSIIAHLHEQGAFQRSPRMEQPELLEGLASASAAGNAGARITEVGLQGIAGTVPATELLDEFDLVLIVREDRSGSSHLMSAARRRPRDSDAGAGWWAPLTDAARASDTRRLVAFGFDVERRRFQRLHAFVENDKGTLRVRDVAP